MTLLTRALMVALLCLVCPSAAMGVAHAEPADATETWNGTIDAKVNLDDYGYTYGQFTMSVVPDGTVTGNGTGKYREDTEYADVSYTISGRRDGADFRLSIMQNFEGRDANSTAEPPAGPFEFIAAVNAYHAKGSITPTLETGDPLTGYVSLECASCQPVETWTGDVTYNGGGGKTVGTITAKVGPDGAVSGGADYAEWVGPGLVEPMSIDVTGRRHVDTLELSIHGYGLGDDWRIDYDFPVTGNVASSSSPEWTVGLTCQGCG